MAMWHVRPCHGPDLFPWVCRICPFNKREFFLDRDELIRHWGGSHREVYNIQEIVHPSYGNHYSHLVDGRNFNYFKSVFPNYYHYNLSMK